MAFKKGQSGNPTGRPKKDGASLKPLLEKHGKAVLQQVINQALEGDIVACRLILDRLYPAIKSAAAVVKVNVGNTLEQTGDNVIAATLGGSIPPDIGSQLITALANQSKLIELTELTERISALEQANEFKSTTN